MVTTRLVSSLVCLLLLTLASAGLGDEYYVDAVSGSDGGAGDRPDTAWRTLTFALSRVPTPAVGSTHTIHIAPGTHDPALGEVFPLVLRPGLRLVGDRGKSVTFLSAGGEDVPVISMTSSLSDDSWFRSDSRVEGVTLRDGRCGLQLVTTWLPMEPTLLDLHITGMTSEAILVSGGGPGASAPFAPTFHRVTMQDNRSGLRARNNGEGTVSSLVVEDCAVLDHEAIGLDLSSGEGRLSVLWARGRVTRSGEDGVLLSAFNLGLVEMRIESGEISRNGGDGVRVQPDHGLGGTVRTILTGSSLVDNVGVGLRLDETGTSVHPTFLSSCLLFGNGDDLSEGPGTPIRDIRFTNVGDGDHAGTDGNLSVDPLFLDPQAGDYRLRFGSPCVDAGDPALRQALDGSGSGRDVDGDLDTVRRPDQGALEARPLERIGEARPGETVFLGCLGPEGEPFRIYYARGGPLSTPWIHEFGEIEIDPQRARFLFRVPAGRDGPRHHPLAIPDNPLLVGRSATLQAVVRRVDAPAGRAVTNAVSMTIAP